MNVIRELGKMGRTVLVSSHILNEIERITEQIVILHQGKLVALGNLHAIRERLDQIPHTIRLVGEDARAMAKDILDHPAVFGLSFPNDRELLIQTFHFGQLHAELPGLIVNNNHKVSVIDNPDDDLESLLNYLSGGSA
jgi:ABC-2 type transport system ATP-binding protein